MKLSTKRKIYYTSVITALVAILVSAVLINRTLINAPEVDYEKIDADAGECVCIYMSYVDENGEVRVSTADKDEQIFAEVLDFINSVQLSEVEDKKELPKSKTLAAWVTLEDENNRVVSRMNFYNGGEDMWYNGCDYNGSKEDMNKLIEYCNRAAVKE